MSVEKAIQEVSVSLGINPQDLIKLINFESGWNPTARNKISGARGLIQFMDSTARGMGFASADDIINKFPDVESQLRGPVLKYLSQYKPFSSPYPQSLYLSVFFPAYRYKSPDTAFSEIVRKQNPGINTVGDYVSFVDRNWKKTGIATIKKYSPIAFFFPISAVALALFYKHFTRRRKQ